MWFIVTTRERSSPTPDEYPHVVLVQDNWDDYGYRTTFSATLYLTEEENVELSSVKILQKKQTGGYTQMPHQPFQDLGPDYCSLGGSLDYYEQLFKCGRKIYLPYLRGLGDVTFSDDVKAEFEDLEGYEVSLLRFSGSQRTIADAAKLFASTAPVRKRRSAGFKVKFKTTVARGADAFTINFDFRRKGSLPNRINVLIGYNGTGKTRLLSNLATVASGYGYTQKEDVLAKRAGRFVGTPPPFKTVVVVSYSALCQQRQDFAKKADRRLHANATPTFSRPRTGLLFIGR